MFFYFLLVQSSSCLLYAIHINVHGYPFQNHVVNKKSHSILLPYTYKIRFPSPKTLIDLRFLTFPVHISIVLELHLCV